MKTMKAKCPNLIFIIADLVENASEVNRRYFNFRDNGLLNCGNSHLETLFGINGFDAYDLNPETAPSTMSEVFARKIGNGVTSDAIFKIAYTGELARKALGR